MSTTSSISRTFSTLAMPVRMRTFMVDSLGGGDVLSTASPLAMWLGHDHRSRGVLLRRRQRPTAAVELGVERPGLSPVRGEDPDPVEACAVDGDGRYSRTRRNRKRRAQVDVLRVLVEAMHVRP